MPLSLLVTGFAVISLVGCTGEDRPQVDVIGGGGPAGGSASVSASGPPSTVASGSTAVGGTKYAVQGNFDIYFAMAADLKEMRELMAPASQGQPVDWAKVRAIYEQGKYEINPTSGAVRSLASLPNDAVHAVFPNGPTAYGRADFINAIVRDGLNGTGRAQGVSDDTRRQIVDKGVQMLFYGKALQEFVAAKTRV